MSYLPNPQVAKVKLLEHTRNPVENLYWSEKYAKSNVELVDLQQLVDWRAGYKKGSMDPEMIVEPYVGHKLPLKEFVQELESWALKVAKAGIPIAEQVKFTFAVEDVTIAFREQLVRSRAGTNFWIQSGRISDYSSFYDRGQFHNPYKGTGMTCDYNDLPDGIVESFPEVPEDNRVLLEDAFEVMIEMQQNLYKVLMGNSSKEEDAREIIGNSALHRLTFSVDLRNLVRILSQRSCQVAQFSQWAYFVKGVTEVVRSVDPLLTEIIGNPPCNKGRSPCSYRYVQEERIEGEDPLPVCPLAIGISKRESWFGDKTEEKVSIERFKETGRWNPEMNKVYGSIWGQRFE